jgi:hypothetical protein
MTPWVKSDVLAVKPDVGVAPNNGVRPERWTVSRGGFDSLPGVVILELCWA